MASHASSVIVTTSAAAARASDVLTFPLAARPQAMTIYTRHVALGTETLSDSRIWSLGPASFTAPLLLLQATTANYVIYHAPISALSAVSSTVTVATYGQLVELCAQLYSDGAVQIHKSVDGGAITSGTKSAAKLLAQTWGSPLLTINGGTGAGVGFIGLRNLRADRGVWDLATMRRKAGV
jgi:hypothetical protein